MQRRLVIFLISNQNHPINRNEVMKCLLESYNAYLQPCSTAEFIENSSNTTIELYMNGGEKSYIKEMKALVKTSK
jgi:hypothetical protein